MYRGQVEDWKVLNSEQECDEDGLNCVDTYTWYNAMVY